MPETSTAKKLVPCAAAAALSLLVFGLLTAVDLVVRGELPHHEGPPNWSAYFLLRVALAILCSALVVEGCRRAGASPASETTGKRHTLTGSVLTIGTPLLAAACAVLASMDATLFSTLGSEDGPVESLSAAAFLLGSGAVLGSWILALRARRPMPRVQWILAPCLAAALFVMGMEEISWMQRVLDLPTPELFASNHQDEINLHNFATDKIEALFYVGSFAFLILLPYLAERSGMLRGHTLGMFVPDRRVLLVAAPLAAINYDMWNNFPIQMGFWLTLMLIGVKTAHTWNVSRRESSLLALAAICLALTQALLVATGGNFVLPWDATEYKELFIALGFAMYAWTVAARIGAVSRGGGGAGAPPGVVRLAGSMER